MKITLNETINVTSLFHGNLDFLLNWFPFIKLHALPDDYALTCMCVQEQFQRDFLLKLIFQLPDINDRAWNTLEHSHPATITAPRKLIETVSIVNYKWKPGTASSFTWTHPFSWQNEFAFNQIPLIRSNLT